MKKPKPNPKPLARVRKNGEFYEVIIGTAIVYWNRPIDAVRNRAATINAAAEDWYRRRVKEKP